MLVEDWIACGLLTGAVILSTCNRVEIYYDAPSSCPQGTERRLIESFLQNLELSPRYAQYIECRQAEEVYRHLFRLSSGLESMVVGETQILGQVKEAYRMASLAEHCPGTLSRLFHRAFEVAKRLRSEYLISTTPLSAGSVSVESLLGLKPSPQEILIIGAGIMSDTIYEHLLHRGQNNIIVYNRTRERAERFAELHPHARVICERELDEALLRAEAIIVATSAPSPIVYPHHLPPIESGRIVIDLGVPRNVAPEVAELSHVQLITIDELGELGLSLSTEVQSQIDSLIEDYVLAHKQWVEGAELREVIATMQRASQLLLEKELLQLPHTLSESDKQLIAQWDEHLRTTYTTAIATALRELSEDGQKRKYSTAIQQIFANIISKHS